MLHKIESDDKKKINKEFPTCQFLKSQQKRFKPNYSNCEVYGDLVGLKGLLGQGHALLKIWVCLVQHFFSFLYLVTKALGSVTKQSKITLICWPL